MMGNTRAIKYSLSLAAMLLLVLAMPIQAESLVGFDPDLKSVNVGETFSLDIVMQGFPNTEGGGLSLQFNPSVVQVISLTVNNSTWTFVNRDGEIDNSNGVVSDILFSNYNGVSDSATIATIDFQAIKRGKCKLQLKPSAISPFASNGEAIPVRYASAVVRVSGK